MRYPDWELLLTSSAPQITSQPFPSMSLPVRCSLFILWLSAIHSELLTVSINSVQINTYVLVHITLQGGIIFSATYNSSKNYWPCQHLAHPAAVVAVTKCDVAMLRAVACPRPCLVCSGSTLPVPAAAKGHTADNYCTQSWKHCCSFMLLIGAECRSLLGGAAVLFGVKFQTYCRITDCLILRWRHYEQC